MFIELEDICMRALNEETYYGNENGNSKMKGKTNEQKSSHHDAHFGHACSDVLLFSSQQEQMKYQQCQIAGRNFHNHKEGKTHVCVCKMRRTSMGMQRLT